MKQLKYMKHITKISLYLILILISQITTIYAQTELDAKPPTLQIGLDGLSFAKGSLDAQLIMEIIAEKQKEIKIKAIQNIFLKKVENAGGTVYSFTDNVVRELVFEKDPKVRTRKILENTVNLVFVSAYLKYYLSSLDNNEDEKQRIVDLAAQYGCKPLDPSKPLVLTSFFTKRKSQSNISFSDHDAVNFLALLLDMCSEVVQNNEKLKQLGLMQISYSSTYDYMNEYKKLITDSCQTEIINTPTRKQKKILNAGQIESLSSYERTLTCVERAKMAKAVYEDLSIKLANVTDYIGLVNFLVTEYSYRNESLEWYSKNLTSGITPLSFKDKSIEIKVLRDKVASIIRLHVDNNLNDSTLNNEIKQLNQIYFYLEKAIRVFEKDDANYKSIADILYTLYAEFKPILLKQSYRSADYLSLIGEIDKVSASIGEVLLMENENFKELKNKVDPFLLIASKLYQFDRSATISEYLKLVEDIGYIFPDDNVKNALSTVITFVKDYTVIGKNQEGEEVINFNVESFIVKLQNIKPYKLSRWKFNMTVGLNNAYFENDLLLSDSSVTRNLSFVGEKIGVKYKIMDRAFWKTRSPGETYKIGGVRKPYIKLGPPVEPFISDYHVLVYGSGLLYNLVNTKSNSEFNMPLIGAGFGLTFYNSLDFNITYGVPIFSDSDFEKSFENSFINVGFDIQFIEYYNRLQSKRNANKVQNKLSAAVNY
jgi:hypothetical protein